MKYLDTSTLETSESSRVHKSCSPLIKQSEKEEIKTNNITCSTWIINTRLSGGKVVDYLIIIHNGRLSQICNERKKQISLRH